MTEVIQLTALGGHPKTYIERPSLKFARVNHNYDRGDALRLYPDEIEIEDDPYSVLPKGHNIPIQSRVWDAIRDINDAAGWAYATTSQAMWINLPGLPRPIDIATEKVNAESIIGGGNLVGYDLEVNGHLRLMAFPYMSKPFGNFQTLPYMYWVPTAVSVGGVVRLVASGVTCFLPLLKYTELWINKNKVTLLPCEPLSWTVADVLGV
jgi:hypothetical protein